MPAKIFSPATVPRDLTSGLVVFFVALPLCLGVALASNAPLISGILAGIIGGILVGMLSGSHSSVSGPAAGLTAIVAAQIGTLGSFDAFLLAVMIAGLMQIALGLLQAGSIAAFFPSSVIKGLLAAIGVILILKQIPHVLGHDADPEGEMAFFQPNNENTFSEFFRLIDGVHWGAATIGLLSIALLITWDKVKFLKKSVVPAPLIVVLLGVGLKLLFDQWGGAWAIGNIHLVAMPVAENAAGFFEFLRTPDFSQWLNPNVYVAAVTIAIVASLETLLNLEAVDKLDPQQRTSPPSRELVAQGVGNTIAGLIGAIPVTSVIVRSSVNLNAGGRTKLSTIFHGTLLLTSAVFLANWLNMIPLSCLAAILLVTGIKLASPALVRQMWSQGKYVFVPFIVTVVAIVLTDLLIGIMIGLGVSVAFILSSSLRRPVRRVVEKHLGGDVLHIQLADQVSFLNRAALDRVLNEVPRGGHVLVNASNSNYIDPDVLVLLRDFKEQTAPARGIEVSLIGFRDRYQLHDQIQYVDYASREIQSKLTPAAVLQILKDGNARFRSGQRLTRDMGRIVSETSQGQHPMAVVFSCMDSRAPAELIFDMGLGDIFSVRIAGNITSRKVLGSLEYGCGVAGAKLLLVLGHTRCGAVTAAVNFAHSPEACVHATGCEYVEPVIREIQSSLNGSVPQLDSMSPEQRNEYIDDVARRNVARSVHIIQQQSATIRQLVEEGKIAVVGAMYNVCTGEIEFVPDVVPESLAEVAAT